MRVTSRHVPGPCTLAPAPRPAPSPALLLGPRSTHVITTKGWFTWRSSARSCATCSVCFSRITSDFFIICVYRTVGAQECGGWATGRLHVHTQHCMEPSPLPLSVIALKAAPRTTGDPARRRLFAKGDFHLERKDAFDRVLEDRFRRFERGLRGVRELG